MSADKAQCVVARCSAAVLESFSAPVSGAAAAANYVVVAASSAVDSSAVVPYLFAVPSVAGSDRTHASVEATIPDAPFLVWIVFQQPVGRSMTATAGYFFVWRVPYQTVA